MFRGGTSVSSLYIRILGFKKSSGAWEMGNNSVFFRYWKEVDKS